MPPVMQTTHALHAATLLSPAYPPSFDNSPVLFAWALFGRALVITLSIATLIRIVSLSRSQHLDLRDPVLQHRVALAGVLGSTTCSSASDVITFLTWNEVSPFWMNVSLMVSRVLDGATAWPLVSALFLPMLMSWWAMREDLLHGIGTHKLLGMTASIGDARPLWPSFALPIKLTLQCGIIAVGVTGVKWWLWLHHVQP